MNDRKLLIDAIATGDVNRLKRLRNMNNPQIIVISAPRNGKYFILSMNKDVPEKEISLAEIDELRKDHNLICLSVAEGRITADVSRSEDEVIHKMKVAGEYIVKKQVGSFEK